MPADLRIEGGADLERVARRLKDTGNKELRKELLRGIRQATKPLKAKVQGAARRDLPQRGGLAALIGKANVGTSTRLSGNNIGVRMTGRNKAIDEGTVRHPVFGRGAWVAQKVTPGFFTETIEGEADAIRREVVDVLEDVAKKIAKGV